MVHQKRPSTANGGRGEVTGLTGNEFLHVMYTNVDGLLSKFLEIKDIINISKPHILCLTETKLNSQIRNEILSGENYNVWRRDRVGKIGGGVLIFTRKELKVKELQMKEVGSASEIVAIEIVRGNEGLIIVNVYVPPLTKAWTREEHQAMLNETLINLEYVIKEAEDRNKNIIITGDLNSKKIDWSTLENPEQENSFGCRLLELLTTYLLHQHIDEPTRMRGSDTPSLLDLVITRCANEIFEVSYKPPLGKSDHALLDFNYILKYDLLPGKEEFKKDRLDYPRGRYDQLREFFQDINWEDKVLSKYDINEQYEAFCAICKQGAEQYIPIAKDFPKAKNDWFGARCYQAKVERDKLWKRYRRHKSDEAYERYKIARNNYTKVRRQEEIDFERGVVMKSKDDPNILYGFINKRTKVKEKIQRIVHNGEIFEEEEGMGEVFNEKFQSVFV